MGSVQKLNIRLHALLILKLLKDYKNKIIAADEFLNSIQNHAKLIINEL